jgi:hypothetical protein
LQQALLPGRYLMLHVYVTTVSSHFLSACSTCKKSMSSEHAGYGIMSVGERKIFPEPSLNMMNKNLMLTAQH